jgi:hypothetical protein
MDEVEILEQRKAQIQQQAAFELGKIEGRIQLLKEQAARAAPSPVETDGLRPPT